MSAQALPLTHRQAWLLSAATGFLALAWEIVWMRLYNFTTSSRALAFGLMLGAYLFGLALGSLWSRRWQHAAGAKPPRGMWGWARRWRQTVRPPNPPLVNLGFLIAFANLSAFLVVPAVSWMVTDVWWPYTLVTVIGVAALLGTILPLICHLAISPDGKAGQHMAGIYLSNIIGSGLGSLVTGFVLMEHLSIYYLCLLLFLTGHIVSKVMRKWAGRAGGIYARPEWVVLFLAGCFGYFGLWERLHYREKYEWGMKFAKTIESRHGVIMVDTHGTIYGNGAYDGSLEVRLHEGSWLVRPYFIGALHAKPKRVLVIGVSGGAWTQIYANHPDVTEVVGVEISEPYLRLIKDSPTVASLYQNPKVKLVVDDGRRWLRQHPGEKFDLIVMNTTHHWREFASALLSREFLELAKSHLNHGGLVAWNCTESARAAKTGMTVFPHTVMLMNFCVASESPIMPDKARWRSLLERWSIDGKPVFDLQTAEGRADLEKCVAYADNEGPWDKEHLWRWMNRARMEERFGGAEIEIITDDNLGHEFAWGNW